MGETGLGGSGHCWQVCEPLLCPPGRTPLPPRRPLKPTAGSPGQEPSSVCVCSWAYPSSSDPSPQLGFLVDTVMELERGLCLLGTNIYESKTEEARPGPGTRGTTMQNLHEPGDWLCPEDVIVPRMGHRGPSRRSVPHHRLHRKGVTTHGATPQLRSVRLF